MISREIQRISATASGCHPFQTIFLSLSLHQTFSPLRTKAARSFRVTPNILTIRTPYLFFHCTLYSRTYHSRVREKRLPFSLVRSYSLPSLNTSKSGEKKKRISQDCHIGPGGRIRTQPTPSTAKPFCACMFVI